VKFFKGNIMDSPTPESEVVVTGGSKRNMLKAGWAVVRKSFVATVTLISEIAVIAVIGSMVGQYLAAKTIVADCQTVSLAKVGDTYVKCTLVEPTKDSVTAPPR
jgi:hypothetical protein